MVDAGQAHHGDALRTYLTTPGLRLRLVKLPSYSPDFNADEVIWGWVCQEETANLCVGTESAVQENALVCFPDNTQSTQMGVLP